jgi:hypothetical protein
VVPLCRIFLWGYWARTSDPQLVDSERRSRLFAGVRSRRIVERNLKASERFSERERTSSVAIVATRIQMSGDSTLAHASVLSAVRCCSLGYVLRGDQ